MHYDLQILNRMEEFLVAQLATAAIWKKFEVRIEGIALTWATRQVVLWSNHKTAADNSGWLRVEQLTGLPTQLKGRIKHGDSDHQSHDRRSREEFRAAYVGAN